MDGKQVVDQTSKKFDAALERFRGELAKLRTGRANAAMLDGITVEAYGTSMPLIQVATISTPEAQLLQITPFDPSNLQAIATAIRNDQTLGLNPTDDGHVVRVPIPPLNEERRRDLAKQIGAKQEECLVAMRSSRHDAQSAIARMKKDKEIGEDDAKRLEKQVDEAMNSRKEQAEAAAKTKETEIMTL